MASGVADNARPRALAVLLSGIAAVALVLLAVAITSRVNMWDIRSGWPVALWRVTMFGSFLTLGLAVITPLVRRRWFGTVVAVLIAALGALAFVLAIGTASASVAGLVLTLPIVILLLGLAAAVGSVFHTHIRRYGQEVEPRQG